jgi:hypothetical protein
LYFTFLELVTLADMEEKLETEVKYSLCLYKEGRI